MAAASPLGEFEQVVLLAILRLADEAYGVTIRREITECTEREPAPGALYTTLDRLEEKGLVASTTAIQLPSAADARSATSRSPRAVFTPSPARSAPFSG